MIRSAKSFVKSAFPSGVRAYRRMREVLSAHNILTPGMGRVFSDIYLNNVWENEESVSGRGSTLERTGVIRRELPALLESVGAKSLLDAPCGDFNWMRHVDLRGVKYLGADVVPELISRNLSTYGGAGRSFAVLDITRDELPKADVILCRDCLIHLSFKHARAAVDNFKRSNSTFLLATTHASVRENTDIRTGGWRPVNLRLPPFNFPRPLRLLTEDAELGKCLGLWSLERL